MSAFCDINPHLGLEVTVGQQCRGVLRPVDATPDVLCLAYGGGPPPPKDDLYKL
jgi:hypothetical protein